LGLDALRAIEVRGRSTVLLLAVNVERCGLVGLDDDREGLLASRVDHSRVEQGDVAGAAAFTLFTEELEAVHALPIVSVLPVICQVVSHRVVHCCCRCRTIEGADRGLINAANVGLIRHDVTEVAFVDGVVCTVENTRIDSLTVRNLSQLHADVGTPLRDVHEAVGAALVRGGVLVADVERLHVKSTRADDLIEEAGEGSLVVPRFFFESHSEAIFEVLYRLVQDIIVYLDTLTPHLITLSAVTSAVTSDMNCVILVRANIKQSQVLIQASSPGEVDHS